MNVNEYLEKTRQERNYGGFTMLSVRPRVECKDGFNVSIQASAMTYCSPREDRGPYMHVELGFPSEKVDEWLEYAETSETPTDTVYGWVPVEIVDQVLEEHGGIINV